MFSKKKAADGENHPSEDGTNRFPLDALLRKAGFQIVSRPNKGPVIWKREGKEYTQREAEMTLNPHDVDDAAYLENLYRDGWQK